MHSEINTHKQNWIEIQGRRESDTSKWRSLMTDLENENGISQEDA